MKKYFEILRKCPLFDNIEDANLEAMMGCLGAKIKKFNKKETVIAEGEPAKFIGIVLYGSVQIERTDYYGNRSIVSKIGASELFGESFACADAPKMPIDVIAAENSEIMLIDCKKIIVTCGSSCGFHNQMIFNLLKIVAQKNLLFNQKLEVTSKRTTREKLMAYLLLQAKKKGCNEFEIPYDRQELADYLEVDRSGLSAEISKLRNEGIVECRKNKFRLI